MTKAEMSKYPKHVKPNQFPSSVALGLEHLGNNYRGAQHEPVAKKSESAQAAPAHRASMPLFVYPSGHAEAYPANLVHRLSGANMSTLVMSCQRSLLANLYPSR